MMIICKTYIHFFKQNFQKTRIIILYSHIENQKERNWMKAFKLDLFQLKYKPRMKTNS